MQRTKQPLPLEGLGGKPEAKGKPSPRDATPLFPARRKNPTYKSYRAMLDRCFRPTTNGYHNYGGRGITVCERWKLSFDDFLDDMGVRPENHVIERKNVNGNYEPGNCQWSPKCMMQRNTRKETVPWLDGESKKEHAARVDHAYYLKNKKKKNEADRLRNLQKKLLRNQSLSHA